MSVLYMYRTHRVRGSGDLHCRNGEQELHGLYLRREPALVLLDHIAGPEMRDSPRECDSTGLGPHLVDMLFHINDGSGADGDARLDAGGDVGAPSEAR